ncbi:hypothetical protein BCR33DRAFT_717387 [Rhizoclosmatium globosum]|uniref:Uncharacterized protein n=1 Tax=Rhizoclosmatium globosum TaxID=329046 RepID=A0A1Y2C9M2_9FUNG|nr:hypothetical protein BCR33DRAFT_717387 [Rhizoclosmatium globosum]|eukprot:ORY43733.1 hypothetical protein BCR33DRAFT_717387 [Rhizoclosmatium globosum]
MALFLIGFILFPAWFAGAFIGLRSKNGAEKLWGYANTLMSFFFVLIAAPILCWMLATL